MQNLKPLIWLVFSFFSVKTCAQDGTLKFETSNFVWNNSGEKKSSTQGDAPVFCEADLTTQVFKLKTLHGELISLMNDDLDRQILAVLGESQDAQFSLQLEGQLLVHLFLDQKKIILTRTDKHPLEWGIQFQEIIESKESPN